MVIQINHIIVKACALNVIKERTEKARFADCHPKRHTAAKGMCSSCYKAYIRSGYEKALCHPDLPEYIKGSKLCDNCYRTKYKVRERSLYNLSFEEYNSLLEKQKHCCALCKLPFNDETPRVDHNHKCCKGEKSCGKCVRGLIHNRCNRGLGLFKDDLSILKLAIEYLEGGTK